MADERKARVQVLCLEIVKLVGLTQGSIEIHCHRGRPKQVDVIDKSLKLDDEDVKPER